MSQCEWGSGEVTEIGERVPRNILTPRNWQESTPQFPDEKLAREYAALNFLTRNWRESTAPQFPDEKLAREYAAISAVLTRNWRESTPQYLTRNWRESTPQFRSVNCAQQPSAKGGGIYAKFCQSILRCLQDHRCQTRCRITGPGGESPGIPELRIPCIVITAWY